MVLVNGACLRRGAYFPAVLLRAVCRSCFLADLARMMRHIPRPVMMGLVNALGILIFVAQILHLLHHAWQV
ncbi:hypothetical protein [Sodalis sp.]|uniref:hypothetical protein n=1 Tax=Sodalis sp. (in: enterobacteria) TaxID=1898979 RepID=UPI003872FA7D